MRYSEEVADSQTRRRELAMRVIPRHARGHAPGVPDRSSARRHWCLDDIPWHDVHPVVVRRNEAFFYLVASASLMESATALYTENLLEYFAGDEEVTSWLEHCWLDRKSVV